MNDSLPQDATAPNDRYDEMFDAARTPRPHWQAVLSRLQADSPPSLLAQREDVQRQVRENGVTYNAWADANGEQRPWDLNLIPLVLPADEWAQIEAAVIQRATLFNHLLRDLYGPQQTIADGHLPAALVHANTAFLRAAHGVPHVDGVALHLYAVDLARSPDGRWWVVADRTQAPSGAGYALENRNIIARALPELLRDLHVSPLQAFFTSLRDSLAQQGRLCAQRPVEGIAPLREDEAALVVMLTPGPTHETYYEQSYLARYLGYPLVEGKDLTVRNGVVWLKTLTGLQRVHVILRHLDDEACDPLELRPHSGAGVVGLADAARRGHVVVANALGAGLLESGALLGYLPGLARALLGEELRMPSVATWWCGEAAALDDVIARLPSLIVKPAFPHLRIKPAFGADLTPGARYTLLRDMRMQPQHYVAQEMVHLSAAPILDHDGILTRAPMGLRVYACATPQGYVVMPGGLTRIASGRDTRLLNMQRGGSAKDTWVLPSGHPVHAAAEHHAPAAPVALTRGDAFLASRTVENLFWYGRYASRCDQLARLARVALDFLRNTDAEDRGSEWSTVQGLCSIYGLLPEVPELAAGSIHVPPLHSDAEVEFALLQSIVQPDQDGLAGSLQKLHAVASKLRERLSLDNWRTLNHLLKQATSSVRHPTLGDAAKLLDDTACAMMTLSGFALDGMTRDNAWRFMSVGRRLERLQFMCNVLRMAVLMPRAGQGESRLDWLLELGDSIVTYRARYMAQPEWRSVLDLLVRDDSNPRSLAFLLDGLQGYLDKLGRHYGPCGGEHFATLQQDLLQLDPERDLDPASPVLASLLERIELACAALSDQLGMRFFSYSEGAAHG